MSTEKQAEVRNLKSSIAVVVDEVKRMERDVGDLRCERDRLARLQEGRAPLYSQVCMDSGIREKTLALESLKESLDTMRTRLYVLEGSKWEPCVVS